MVLLALAVLGGGIYVISRRRKNKRACRLRRQQMAAAQGSLPPVTLAPGQTKEWDSYQTRGALPAYTYDVRHQRWCNGTCAGACMADMQYTPDESPIERTGRDEYFVNGVDEKRLLKEKMGNPF